MAIELYNKDGHVCLMFTHLGDEDGEAVQATSFWSSTSNRGPSSIRAATWPTTSSC